MSNPVHAHIMTTSLFHAPVPSSLSDYCLTRSEQARTGFEAAFWFVLAEWSEQDPTQSATLDEYHAQAMALRASDLDRFSKRVLTVAGSWS